MLKKLLPSLLVLMAAVVLGCGGRSHRGEESDSTTAQAIGTTGGNGLDAGSTATAQAAR